MCNALQSFLWVIPLASCCPTNNVCVFIQTAIKVRDSLDVQATARKPILSPRRANNFNHNRRQHQFKMADLGSVNAAHVRHYEHTAVTCYERIKS